MTDSKGVNIERNIQFEKFRQITTDEDFNRLKEDLNKAKSCLVNTKNFTQINFFPDSIMKVLIKSIKKIR